MPASAKLLTSALDLLEGFGTLRTRKMFGGTMIGLLVTPLKEKYGYDRAAKIEGWGYRDLELLRGAGGGLWRSCGDAALGSACARRGAAGRREEGGTQVRPDHGSNIHAF